MSERVQSYYLIFAKILFEGMIFSFVLNPEWEQIPFYHRLHKVLSLGKAMYPFDGDLVSSCLGGQPKRQIWAYRHVAAAYESKLNQSPRSPRDLST